MQRVQVDITYDLSNNQNIAKDDDKEAYACHVNAISHLSSNREKIPIGICEWKGRKQCKWILKKHGYISIYELYWTIMNATLTADSANMLTAMWVCSPHMCPMTRTQALALALGNLTSAWAVVASTGARKPLVVPHEVRWCCEYAIGDLSSNEFMMFISGYDRK